MLPAGKPYRKPCLAPALMLHRTKSMLQFFAFFMLPTNRIFLYVSNSIGRRFLNQSISIQRRFLNQIISR
jgi:hypothetical protein